jgi:acyl-CoA synthetase (AMP-forming)/AMP-acid ligase II
VDGVPAGSIRAAGSTVGLGELARASSLGGRLEELRGRSVLVATQEQLAAALALIELDGVARRVVLCPPGLSPEHLPAVVDTAEVDACTRDFGALDTANPRIRVTVTVDTALKGTDARERRRSHDTEWVLLTSGTTGVPKLVLHTLTSLSSAVTSESPPLGSPSTVSADEAHVVWSTFYDIRRYGGLQIFLRGLRAGSFVLSSPAESVPDFLARAGAAAVTHTSGTPSHWRRALMSGAAGRIRPRYVRLSGEIADQAILDGLRAAYPDAVVAHAFATTEAGVAFEVQDGSAGFPASLVGGVRNGVELRVVDETLRIRSPGNAVRYLGERAPALKGPDGSVDTGDRIELREGRYYFGGRRGGVINVGGLKVYPEEIEAVINSHPWVRVSLVKARRSPITGALVAADVVLSDSDVERGERPAEELLRREILETCRLNLAPYKIPAMVRFVDTLEISESGKLVRPNA